MIQALLACSNKHGLSPTDCTDYYSFFRFITQDCPPDDYTHISWSCTRDKKTICNHVLARWQEIIDNFSLFIDVTDGDYVTVHMEVFKHVMVSTKSGEKKRLKAVQEDANMAFIVNFTSDLLPKIIYHRNELKHFRSVAKEFCQLFNTIYIDVDFAENLTIPMKDQPQSLYWTQQHLSVHSGISKSRNGKSYHPYISDCKIHDQVFSKNAILEILAEEDVTGCDYIVIDSDNCSSQYKSGLHFLNSSNVWDSWTW